VTERRYHAAIFGWYGSRERHLRAIARHHESLGASPIVAVPRSFETMSRPDGWQKEGNLLAARVPRDGLPLLVHAFSNAGFWSATALLDALDPRVPFAGSVIDSAPGFPEKVSPLFTAKYASRAMMPSLLERLGRKPALRHPLLTPPLMAFMGVWHLLSPAQVRFMEGAQAAMRARHRGLPLTVIWGGKDELVRAHHVERFAAAAEREGAHVERVYFADGDHVRHLVDHRREYLAAVERFVDRAV
jgi:pimeloyl-ACP methyl ester carboxylesterase